MPTDSSANDRMLPAEAALQAIESLLRRQRSGDLEPLFRRSWNDGGRRAQFDCARRIVEICLKLDHRKLAGRWLLRMPALCEPEDVPVALALAVQARQISVILTLRERFPTVSADAEQVLDLARGVLALALRARLPFGRQGAWKTHLALLAWVRDLALGVAADGSPEHVRAEAEAMLMRIRQLQTGAGKNSEKC